jgi:hypothetical protein
MFVNLYHSRYYYSNKNEKTPHLLGAGLSFIRKFVTMRVTAFYVLRRVLLGIED